MGEFLVQREALLYNWAFFGSIAAAAAVEGFWPRRTSVLPLRGRWLRHFAIAGLDQLTLRLLLPLLEVAAALAAARAGLGLFHQLDVPRGAAFALSLVALDAVRYASHRLLHAVPWLWRLHRVHHTDVDYDFTTALRFHPLESILTGSVGVATVAALGAPLEAVVVDKIVFAAAAFFAHANVRLPARLDRALRVALVTPDLHRVHHSARREETNSNYSSVCPVWDRLLGTYVAAPASGHESMTVGLPVFREAHHGWLGWMLANPFLAERAGASADAEPSPS
jgi:sterol desaturase/sphingolipid hydroxylase (fatty acid hydroxylase superfamily)